MKLLEYLWRYSGNISDPFNEVIFITSKKLETLGIQYSFKKASIVQGIGKVSGVAQIVDIITTCDYDYLHKYLIAVSIKHKVYQVKHLEIKETWDKSGRHKIAIYTLLLEELKIKKNSK